MSYLTRDQLDEYLKNLSLKNSPQRKPSLSTQRLSTSPSRLTVPPNSPNSGAVRAGSLQPALLSGANVGQLNPTAATTNGSKPVVQEREQADATMTTTVEPISASSVASDSTTTDAFTADKEGPRAEVDAVKDTPLNELDSLKKNLQSPFKFPAKLDSDATQRPKPEPAVVPKPIVKPRPEPKSTVKSKSTSTAASGSIGFEKPRPSPIVKRQSKTDLVKSGSTGAGASSNGNRSANASPKASPTMRPSSMGGSSPKSLSLGRQRTGSVGSIGSGEDGSRTTPTGPYFSRPFVLTVPPSGGPRVSSPGSPKKTTASTSTNCAGCNEPIAGNVLSALGKRWHPHHFVCKHCDVALEHVGFFEHEGYPYCHLDFHELFSPRCAYCETPIEGQVINALGKSWHPGHFFCRECGNPFEGGGFMVHDGHAYCQKDWMEKFAPKCKACNEPITGEHNNALGGMWHRHCFRCTGCSSPFNDSFFYAREQKPYCGECYRGLLST